MPVDENGWQVVDAEAEETPRRAYGARFCRKAASASRVQRGFNIQNRVRLHLED